MPEIKLGEVVEVLGFTPGGEKGEPVLRAEFRFAGGKVYDLRWSPAWTRYGAAREAGVPMAGDCEGGMFGFFFTRSSDDGLPPQLPQNYAEVMATDKERFNRFFHAMLDRGVYFAPALYEAGFVSSAHGAAEIDATVSAARAALRRQAGDERIA